MRSTLPPVISFELGLGDFRIVTPEAVYQIKVTLDLVEAMKHQTTEDVSSRDQGPGQNFFKEISEELFQKVGLLARKLSTSVDEPPLPASCSDLTKTGEELENAKDQLQQVVQITEQASMTIMDVADQIQTDMDQLQDQINILHSLDLAVAAGAAESGAPVLVSEAVPAAEPGFLAKLAELKRFVEKFLPAAPAEAAAEPAAVPEPNPVPERIGVTTFDLDVVFQTLYELCTNESVKDHIKEMWNNRSSTFTETAVARALTDMSATVENEDGFYNFPIPGILKILYQACGSEDYKVILKKMNQTAASIFLDSILPVEGQTEEVEAPQVPAEAPILSQEPPSAREPEPSAALAAVTIEDLAALAGLVDDLEKLAPAAEGAPVKPVAAVAGPDGLYTTILTSDRDTIVQTVALSNQLIKRTADHLTRIMEALSFQDLSGQRIKKIVALISDLQVQLLSILVSVDSKIKTHQEDKTVEPGRDSQAMAQEKVDEMLEKVVLPDRQDDTLLGPAAEGRLDQDAVNDLLASLGF